MAWQFFTKSGTEKNYRADSSVSTTGIITPFAGSSAPSGWLLCQGQELARSSYPALERVLGQTYGAFTNGSGSAGSTHFKLPDLRGRTMLGSRAGKGDNVAATSYQYGTTISPTQLGTYGGVESVTLTAAQAGVKAHTHSMTASHTHTVTNTTHSHTILFNSTVSTGSTTLSWPNGGNPAVHYTSYTSLNCSLSSVVTGITINSCDAVNASASHDNMQPFLVTNYIIKT